MSRAKNTIVQDNPSWFKNMKYNRFVSEHEWIMQFVPRVLEGHERAHELPSPHVTAFYLEYVGDSNVSIPLHPFYFETFDFYDIYFSQMHPMGFQRLNAFILACFGGA